MLKIKRHKSRVVKIGNLFIGGNNPIAIQSMAKVKTEYAEKVIHQIGLLEDAGCEIVRVAVKDAKDAKAIKKIKPKIHIPLVADIHFDWRLGLESIESGVDKIRLNPGNIFKKVQVKELVRAAKGAKIPIRVGLNSGSIGDGLDQVGAMVKAASAYLEIFEWIFIIR